MLQKKILISLTLIVLVPIALLAWLGLRMANNEQQVVQAQLKTLVTAQLTNTDETIIGYFHAIQNDLISSANNLAPTDESIKKFTLESNRVKNILMIDADGKRLYPSLDSTLSHTETQFLQRTSAIWNNPKLLTQGAALPLPPATNSAYLNKQKTTEETTTPQLGWYTWHWDAELHHMFWWRDAQNRVIGFELSPVTVLSDLIARLPATNKLSENSSTKLINSSGQIIYEWGQYNTKPDEKNLAMLPLSHPLGSWKLEYFAPALTGAATTNTFSILIAVLVLGLALIALAIYLYREHQREVHLAQQRVNFVNQVSHELKTPLTNIRLYAELLEAEVSHLFDDDQQQEGDKAQKFISIITSESQRLSRLIANVLRFGQFQKSELKLNMQKAHVDEIIERCITAFGPALQAKSIAVHLDLHADALVWLDVEALEQIINNLISNLEKYAASGRMLQVASHQSNDLSSISVRDFGPGIATRERERIFEPFYRVSSLLTDGVTGTGIGLDIARQLARLHGGDLVLQNVDIGACFLVTLRTTSPESNA
jgi:signal transduction histidine kinase